MNERIKAIGRQAGFAFIEDGVYGQRWYSSKCGMGASEFEKFAKLIVAECIKLCGHESNNDIYDPYDMGMSAKAEDIKTLIKEHFGVES
jgi:hypothetical protein